MPDVAEFCPSCGRPVKEGNFFAPEESSTGSANLNSEPAQSPSIVLPPVEWQDRVSGAVAYLTFIPAIAFLFLKQYKGRKFVRFHAFQSVFFWSAVVIFALLGVLASMFGWLFGWLLTGTLIGLALFLTWVLLSIKALQGEWFGLPWVGAVAEEQAGR